MFSFSHLKFLIILTTFSPNVKDCQTAFYFVEVTPVATFWRKPDADFLLILRSNRNTSRKKTHLQEEDASLLRSWSCSLVVVWCIFNVLSPLWKQTVLGKNKIYTESSRNAKHPNCWDVLCCCVCRLIMELLHHCTVLQ